MSPERRNATADATNALFINLRASKLILIKFGPVGKYSLMLTDCTLIKHVRINYSHPGH